MNQNISHPTCIVFELPRDSESLMISRAIALGVPDFLPCVQVSTGALMGVIAALLTKSVGLEFPGTLRPGLLVLKPHCCKSLIQRKRGMFFRLHYLYHHFDRNLCMLPLSASSSRMQMV